MPPKPFVAPVDVSVAAASTPTSSVPEGQEAVPKKPVRAKATKAEARPKKKESKGMKVKGKVQEAPLTNPEHGLFRCLCCDYKVVIAPGTPKPKSGWRCPYDFSSLQWVSL